jgi:hypothetical protein
MSTRRCFSACWLVRLALVLLALVAHSIWRKEILCLVDR